MNANRMLLDSLAVAALATCLSGCATPTPTMDLAQRGQGDWARPDQVGDVFAALRSGGYVIVMRHGKTDQTQVDHDPVDLDDCDTQRNLTDIGRYNAHGWGKVLRAEEVPIAIVITSEYCRTKETGEYLGFKSTSSDKALNLPQQLDPDSQASQGRALLELASRQPPGAANVLLVTHNLNMVAAFGADAAGVEEADALVLRPKDQRPEVVARLHLRSVATYAMQTGRLSGSRAQKGAAPGDPTASTSPQAPN